jgi:hypothetical protein
MLDPLCRWSKLNHRDLGCLIVAKYGDFVMTEHERGVLTVCEVPS